jgi:flagellar M-ring protein FliF
MSEAGALPDALLSSDGRRTPSALLARARALLASPALVRARPALLGLAGAALLALLWALLRDPEWRPLYPGMADADAAAVSDALAAANFDWRVNRDTAQVEVPAADLARARILLAGQGLPKSSAFGASVAGAGLTDMPLGASRSVEAARLKAALEAELAASVEAIDGVKAARVHVAAAEPSVFIRDRAPPSASVFVTLAPGRSLSDAQVRAVIWLVATSVPGLSADRVSLVDQSGTLLSAGLSGDAQQLAYQQRLEGLVRERLVKLLTPMLGQGRFTAEVAADVDFSQNEAASERFQPAGTVRTEQTSRNSEAGNPPAQGIPGALTNTAPPAAQISATPPPAPPPAAAAPTVTAETANRSFEIGKDVSVTRAAAPRLKRLSVALVVDAGVLGRNNARDLAAIRRLVQGAMGYDAARGDLIELETRRFAGDQAPAEAWYDAPAVRTWGPIAAGAVLLLAGGLGWWLWRRRRAAAAQADLPPPAPRVFGDLVVPAGAPIDGGDLRPAAARDYSGKLDKARTLVTGDRDRAMAVARQMLLAPGQAPPAAGSPAPASSASPVESAP